MIQSMPHVSKCNDKGHMKGVWDKIKSEGVDKLLKPAHERKSPDDIKKELNKK